MGRQRRDQGRLFYEFRLEDRIPENRLLRRINVFVTVALADLHKELKPHYSDIGRPSVDPELMIRMLIVGYCYGIRSERKLCQEVELHLAYRWFCKLDLDDEIPHHSTFSENRLGRFRESDLLRHIFERVVWAAMAMGLVKGEGFAVDASVLEANASRYHGKALDELDWTEKQRQTRAVREYLAALDEATEPDPNRKPPKVISPSDPSSAGSRRTRLTARAGSSVGWSRARTSSRISRSATPVSVTTARSRARTSNGTRAMASTSVRTTRFFTPPAPSMKAPPFDSAPARTIAIAAPSKRGAAQTHPSARSHATSTRMPATWRVGRLPPRRSSNRAISASASKCAFFNGFVKQRRRQSTRDKS